MFEVISFRTEIKRDFNGKLETDVVLKVKISDKIELVAGDGLDLKDAFVKALNKILRAYYPFLENLEIIQHQVFVLNRNRPVAVMVFSNQGKIWASQAQSENTCEAILQAVVKGFKKAIKANRLS